MTSIRRMHFPEVVPYPQWEEWLIRCNCGARIWCSSEEEAANASVAHRKAPHDQVVPRRIHAVLGTNDKGSVRQVWSFPDARAAFGFIEGHSGSPHYWGWSFAYLTGHRSPKWLIEQLSLPGMTSALTALELPSGE